MALGGGAAALAVEDQAAENEGYHGLVGHHGPVALGGMEPRDKQHQEDGGACAAESLTSLDAVCNAGSQCTEVQASPVAAGALAALKNAVSTSKTSLGKKLDAATALLAAIKVMVDDFEVVRTTSRSTSTRTTPC